MARKKKTPLYKSILDGNIIIEPGPKDTKDTKDTKSTDGGSILGGEDTMKAYRDAVYGLDVTAAAPGPKEIDTSNIDTQIAAVEKPTGKSVFDKQAAYYRQQGEAQVLRNQKDLAALTQPTITLYKERIAASNAKYELLKDQMKEFDTSNIFGEEGPNKIPMPIVGEIKNISKSVKADMRELSRLNINDPRYDELREKMEKDQQLIVEFDKINQQLIKIRNDKESNGSESDNWSTQMPPEEHAMWQDIYTGNGENIKIIDGKLQWVDPDTGEIRDLSKIGDEPTLRSAKAQKASFSMLNSMYNAIEKGANATGNAAARSLYNEALGDVEFMYDKLKIKEQASLLFDSMDEKDTKSVNTNDFVNSILEENNITLSYLIEEGMLESYTDPETGKKMPLRQMFKNWYLDEVYEKTKPLTPTNITGGGDKDPKDKKITSPSSWVNFKQDFNTHDFSTDEKFMLPTSSVGGKVIDPYLTINNDGTYNIELGEDDNRNQDNLTVVDTAKKLQEYFYPNISIDAIQSMVTGQSDGQEDYTKESFQSKEQAFANLVAKEEEPYIKRMSQGADVNYIAKNIWEPNTPKGYNMGENGKALFDYLAKNGYGSKNESLYDLGNTNWGGRDFIEFPKEGTKGMTLTYDGEYVYIYERNMRGYSGEPKKWGGDSTGGLAIDKADIREILKELGIAY